MKTTKTLGLLALCALVTVTISSCAKFDDGGSIGDAEKNIKAGWKLQKYLRNSVDETALVLVKNYEETYSDGGGYYISYIDDKGASQSTTGKWEFKKDTKKFHVSGISSIGKWSAQTSTVSNSEYNILKLDATEYWYHYTNGSDRHDFRFVKK